MTSSIITGREAPTSRPATQQGTRKNGAIRWHYTTGQKFMLILRDGVIKPATAFVPPGEKPIVWFSTNQDWEPTACKAMIDSDGKWLTLTMQQTGEFCGGLVRIGVSQETAPHDWHALKETSGMSSRMAHGLYRSGIDQGARPGQWFGCFDPVPRSKWIAVQVLHEGHWVDAGYLESQPAQGAARTT